MLEFLDMLDMLEMLDMLDMLEMKKYLIFMSELLKWDPMGLNVPAGAHVLTLALRLYAATI